MGGGHPSNRGRSNRERRAQTDAPNDLQAGAGLEVPPAELFARID